MVNLIILKTIVVFTYNKIWHGLLNVN